MSATRSLGPRGRLPATRRARFRRFADPRTGSITIIVRMARRDHR